MTIDPNSDVKLFIFWSSYFYFLAAPALVWLSIRKLGHSRIAALSALSVITVFAYARFVEPRMLTVKTHQVALERCFPESGAARLAVVSDLHIGVFQNAMPVRTIADRIGTLNVDAALIPGDLTYWLEETRFREVFRALGEVTAPVYAVLGNHDVGLPGPPIADALASALQSVGISTIDDEAARLSLRGDEIEIVGLSDLWLGRQRLALADGQSQAPRIVLTHNPETVWALSGRGARNASDASQASPFSAGSLRTHAHKLHADLIVSGHTHGGQIYIPFVTCRLARIACSPLRYGLGSVDGYSIFVTSGTGMVGLPMRFLVPPRIDVLNISWRACADPQAE